MKNYYRILNLQPDAPDEQVKKQYKALLREWQPDKFSSPQEKLVAEEKTRLINEAFETLSVPIRREAYNETLITYIDQEPEGTTILLETQQTKGVTEPGNRPEDRDVSGSRKNFILLTGLGVILFALVAVILVSRLNTGGTGNLSPKLTTVLSAATIASTTDLSAQSTPLATPVSTEGEATLIPTVAFSASDPATCKPVAILPALTEERNALFPSVTKDDWTLGQKNASVVIYEYGDFESSYFAKAAPALKELLAAYPKDVLIVFRHFPVSSIHPNSILAAQAVESAGAQNKFWQMHDLLFERQSEWSVLSAEDFETWLKNAAKSINLDSNQFMSDLVSDEIVQKVAGSIPEKMATELKSAPTLFFNKFSYGGNTDLDSLISIVKYFLLPQKSYLTCPEMTIDPEKTYMVTIKTEKGDVLLELYPKQAPWAVNSFVFLARNHWFDGSAFFRVIPDFVAQAGDPSNSGLGGPGYEFTNEVTPELRFDKTGVMGMVNSGNNDNGSQFFITYSSVPDIDGKYTIFGQVIEGMDVLTSLRPRKPETDLIPITPDAILSITVEEK
jgi:cyclophilin family peptidyl-prolyl cis-trans isomerase/protein-disulfide isomerase